jgi:hypothetical protein
LVDFKEPAHTVEFVQSTVSNPIFEGRKRALSMAGGLLPA